MREYYRRRALVDDAAVRLAAARREAALVARRLDAARFDATPADTFLLDAVDVSPMFAPCERFKGTITFRRLSMVVDKCYSVKLSTFQELEAYDREP